MVSEMYDELIIQIRQLQNWFKPNESECFDPYEILEKAADAIEDLQKQLQKSEEDNVNLTGWLAEEHAKHLWIPVTEQLPDHRTTCLIADDGSVVVGWRNLVGEWYDVTGDRLKYVTHWMPLPSTEGINGG